MLVVALAPEGTLSSHEGEAHLCEREKERQREPTLSDFSVADVRTSNAKASKEILDSI